MSTTLALSSGLASATDTAGDNGVSSVDVASAVGTWVATLLALIALIGLVAPYLALRAALSDQNRALNAVYDRRGTYMTRGIRISQHLRVLRRMRVPDLAPRYAANEWVDGPLLVGAGADGVYFTTATSTTPWTLGLAPIDYAEWNTGWAKLATLLLRGYTVGGRPLTELGVAPCGGTLEAVNNRTALVVSRHWLLLLGLLGRYGRRRDKGVLRADALLRRRDDGERLNIANFSYSRRQATNQRWPFSYTRRKARESDRERYEARPVVEDPDPDSETDSSSEPDSDPGSEPDTDSSSAPRRTMDTPTIFHARRTAFGVLSFEVPDKRETIHGITGTLHDLGRHKGSWSHMTTVAFVPHAANEVAAPGLPPKTDPVSLATLFWLANGFLPAGFTAAGQPVVLSLEGPPPPDISMPEKRFMPHEYRSRKANQQAFSLQPCTELPSSLGTAMRGLGIALPRVLHFLPVPAGSAAAAAAAATAHEHKHRMSDTGGDLQIGTAGLGGWACWRHPDSSSHCLVPRVDLTRLIAAFLALPSDPWGFLCGKEPFWCGILRPVTRLLQHDDVARLVGSGALPGVPPDTRAFHWRLRGTGFNQAHIVDRHVLDGLLVNSFSSLRPPSGAAAVISAPLRTALAVLSVLDASYRDLLLAACARLSGDDDGHGAKQGNSRAARKYGYRKTMQDTLRDWREFTLDMDHRGLGRGADHGSRVFDVPRWQSPDTTMQTLATFGVAYEQENAANPRRLRFNDPISPFQKQLILAHGLAQAKLCALEAEDHLGQLRYDAAEKTLTWYRAGENGEDGPTMGKWPLDVPFVPTAAVPAAPPVVNIAHVDAIRAALWAANRAAMWLGSLDAEPFLSFYGELDPHVYVM